MGPPETTPPEFQQGFKAGFHEGLEEARRQAKDPKGKEEEKKQKEEKKPPNRWQRMAGGIVRNRAFQVVAAVVVLLILGLFIYEASIHESTDDAYTEGHIHNIASRVTGTVLEVRVDDNEVVHQGDVLVVLDPTDYQVQVDQARAEYIKAKADLQRSQGLQKAGAVSQQDIDANQSATEVAAAKLKDAEDQLAYCTIRAPSNGRIGHKTVETGNRLNVGAALMAVTEDAWVVANFKETQLGKMKPGQEAAITIDAIPHKTFEGVVDSWAPGSGATFALLPPDNATGNFTKIVQRVPVKIRFKADSIRGFENRIVPGLSCEPNVLLRGGEANRSAPTHPHPESIPLTSLRQP